ncbi:hypothetical protein A9Q84_16315 [Halobacteriovorax marinus]|uniref:Lipid/polyisoprenoid-binding YceI-like domain-containing protein n=1 Tax=Halobacteriovorax marinus TaxID=97084 RepID=A0A1Y5F4A1_9BACT|nr:hypothetical protein A9Q84_16315 [Halobacteriovorax marinus]
MRFLLIYLTCIFTISAVQVKGSLEFLVKTNVPGMSVSGYSNIPLILKYEVSDQAIKNIKFSLNPKLLKTGMDLRDDHLQEFLKNKMITFTGLKGCKFQNGKCELSGKLSLAGIEREIILSIVRNDKHFYLLYNLSLTGFGFDLPNFAGVTVKDSVEIKFKFE